MSATFIERCIHRGDYENDGGAVDLDEFENCLVMYEAGMLTNTAIIERFAESEPQEEQIQDLLNTMPATTLSLNVPLVGILATPAAVARAQWVRSIRAVLNAGLWSLDAESTDGTYLDGFDTAAEVETALGL